jgi:hypothetical protein
MFQQYMRIYTASKNVLEPASYLQCAWFPDNCLTNSNACCDAHYNDDFNCEYDDISKDSVAKNSVVCECSSYDDWEHVHYNTINIE